MKQVTNNDSSNLLFIDVVNPQILIWFSYIIILRSMTKTTTKLNPLLSLGYLPTDNKKYFFLFCKNNQDTITY